MSHGKLHPLPTEFPSEAIKCFKAHFRNEEGHELDDVIQAGWEILGYGAYIKRSFPLPMFAEGEKRKNFDTSEKVLEGLEELEREHKQAPRVEDDEDEGVDHNKPVPRRAGKTKENAAPKRAPVGANGSFIVLLLPVIAQMLAKLIMKQ